MLIEATKNSERRLDHKNLKNNLCSTYTCTFMQSLKPGVEAHNYTLQLLNLTYKFIVGIHAMIGGIVHACTVRIGVFDYLSRDNNLNLAEK